MIDIEYAWYCPVCEKIRKSETCPKCPGVLLLKVKREFNPKFKTYFWRKLA